MIWLCPKCKQKLLEESGSLSCEQGHCYDRARQGYLYLLLANQKHSREPGDNADMIRARRDFLRDGHYQPLPSTIVGLLSKHLPVKEGDELTLLDLGCGEGYYLEYMAAELCQLAHSFVHCYGVDLSKEAVKKAAVAGRNVVSQSSGRVAFDYAVASTFNLPVIDQQIDVALNIFAPVSFEEISRTLKPEGLLVRVMPGPQHLFQIKQYLYEQPTLHELEGVDSSFSLVEREQLRFQLNLNSSTAVKNLLKMTPLYYHGNQQGKEQLENLDELLVDIDFDIQVLIKS